MRLSHELAPLRTQGNRIVRAHDLTPLLLRGVNRSGMEYTGPAGVEWDDSEFDRIVTAWRANVVRIPFNQDWALAREAYDPLPYLLSMDRAIELAARRGAYTILALQWLNNRQAYGHHEDGRPQFIPPLPDSKSADLWRQLAVRYRDEPAVLYDLFTEPHDVGMSEWQRCAATLIDVVREQNPAALILISGVNWGYDLRGHPIPGIEGVVYSTHIYRNKGRDWPDAFGKLSEVAPVFAGEWGGDAEDVAWGRKLAAYLAERGIGWTAWGWPDRPPLIGEQYEPTSFGSLVRSQMQSDSC